MTDIIWNVKVNTKVRRDGTSWSNVQGFITDKTRSGKPKRRYANSMGKRPFNVSFIFTLEEYEIFENWYNNIILKGAKSFLFPKIDAVNGVYTEYQIADGGAPSYSNSSGKLIRCTMKWEEV